jgi:outer membrane protein TolC
VIVAVAAAALLVCATPEGAETAPTVVVAAAADVPAPASARALTLDDAIDLAIAHDPRVDRAALEVERARLRTKRANLERLRASVDVSAQALYVSPAFFSPSPGAPLGAILPLGTLQGAVDAPLFSGWRIESDIEEATALEAASAADVDAERAAVGLAAARAWWSVRRLSLLEDALLASDTRLQESERLVKARIAAGLAPGLDENRAASRRVQLEVERQGLQAQRREALVQLALVLGVATPITLADAPAVVGGGVAADVGADVGADVDRAIERAFEHRPQLRAGALRLRALSSEKKATESAWWPQLDAVGLLQLGNNPSVPGADARSVSAALLDGNLQAGLVLKWNLFDTWSTATAVDDVDHRRRIADAEQRAQRNNVEGAVRLAFARVVSLQEQRALLGRTRAILDDNLASLDKAWQRGEVLFTEVLDAQVEIAGNDRQLVDVDAQLALARLELRAATDGVVSSSSTSSSSPPATPAKGTP